MQKFIPLVILTAFVISSCGNEANTNGSTDSIPKIIADHDTAIIIDTVPPTALALTLGGDTIAPSDKSMIFYRFTKDISVKKGKLLSVKEVKKRFAPLDPLCDNEAAYKFQRFFFLDSLKKAGSSPETDMGQTVRVDIRVLDTIKKTADGSWVMWSMEYETSQSCPYASGTYYMLSTYDAAGKNISTQCMSRSEGGADAPLWWNAVQETNVFSDGSFRGLMCDTTGDYDDNDKPIFESIVRKTFTGQIAQGGKITVEEKEIERNE
ncbi:MAG TPA: hypothetical protein VK826_11155 [Bacteroidia bacterium]|nr:hypothetical protein [Bacteroidia bacterium]